MDKEILIELKQCIKCLQNKSLDMFYKEKRNNTYRSYCKDCNNFYVNERQKFRRKTDPEYRKKINERSKKYYSKRKESNYKTSLKRNYNMTPEQYDLLFKQQNGCCKICGVNQKLLKKRLFVDHCHKTGKVRGLLCQMCNHALGLLKDNKQNIENMLKYLE